MPLDDGEADRGLPGSGRSALLLPSEPSYDPWPWLVWARELTHVGLDTTAGPSWKLLTVALLVPVAPP